MKKVILKIIILLLFICSPAYCSTKQNAEISKIETDFYGFEYTNDSIQNRVSRLEKTIYGKASTGDINKRITKDIINRL